MMTQIQVLLFSKDPSSRLLNKLAEAGFIINWQRELEQVKEIFVQQIPQWLLIDFSHQNDFQKADHELKNLMEYTHGIVSNSKSLLIVPDGFPMLASFTVSAFRYGVDEIVIQKEDWLSELLSCLIKKQEKQIIKNELLRTSYQLNKDFFQRLIKNARQLQEFKEKQEVNLDPQENRFSILVVEADSWLFDHISQDKKKDIVVKRAIGGGLAFDKASKEKFDLVLVQQNLPDLSGSLVLQNLLEQYPQLFGILFEPPTQTAGKAVIKKGNQNLSFIEELTQPIQLIKCIEELFQIQRQQMKERRYLFAFRKENQEILKKYHELCQKIEQYFLES